MATSMNLVIHAAVRRDLDRFATALGAMTPGDTQRARELGVAWANFDHQLTHHHQGEHEIVWPALLSLGVSPSLLEEMDAEHEAMADALAHARVAIGALTSSSGPHEVDAARTAVERLREVTGAHLDHEEREIEPVYAAHHDSPEAREIGRRMSRAQSMPEAGTFFAWVQDGISAEHRDALRGQVPGPVLRVLGLLGRRYRRTVAPVWAAG